MKVSIITASFNSSKWLMKTYSSILSQTYTNWEWLITDDSSSDDSYSILCEIAKLDNRVKVFKNTTNSG